LRLPLRDSLKRNKAGVQVGVTPLDRSCGRSAPIPADPFALQRQCLANARHPAPSRCFNGPTLWRGPKQLTFC